MSSPQVSIVLLTRDAGPELDRVLDVEDQEWCQRILAAGGPRLSPGPPTRACVTCRSSWPSRVRPGYVRRDFLRAHPFDETIPIMEDALWALDRGPGERVVYVPEATVFHSHPLRLRYWRARYYQHGLAHRYIRARRGIDLLPERSRGPVGRLGHRLAEARRLGPALARQGRWWHLAAYPVFAAARELALRRGFREGRARFGDQDRRPTSPSSP